MPRSETKMVWSDRLLVKFFQPPTSLRCSEWVLMLPAAVPIWSAAKLKWPAGLPMSYQPPPMSCRAPPDLVMASAEELAKWSAKLVEWSARLV